jgi:hypothetical protein
MKLDACAVVDDAEGRALMLAGEQSSAGQVADDRSGIAARDVDAFMRAPVESSQRTAIRWAAFSLDNPSIRGNRLGRISSSLMRQMPAIEWPLCSFGTNGRAAGAE